MMDNNIEYGLGLIKKFEIYYDIDQNKYLIFDAYNKENNNVYQELSEYIYKSHIDIIKKEIKKELYNSISKAIDSLFIFNDELIQEITKKITDPTIKHKLEDENKLQEILTDIIYTYLEENKKIFDNIQINLHVQF